MALSGDFSKIIDDPQQIELIEVRRQPMVAVDEFRVADHFRVGAVIGGREIGELDYYFEKVFHKIVETNIPSRELVAYDLATSMVNPYAFGKVFPEQGTHTAFAHIHQVMEHGMSFEEERRTNVAYYLKYQSPEKTGLDVETLIVYAVLWRIVEGKWKMFGEDIYGPRAYWPKGIRFFAGPRSA